MKFQMLFVTQQAPNGFSHERLVVHQENFADVVRLLWGSHASKNKNQIRRWKRLFRRGAILSNGKISDAASMVAAAFGIP